MVMIPQNCIATGLSTIACKAHKFSNRRHRNTIVVQTQRSNPQDDGKDFLNFNIYAIQYH
jgi:hypothetical protein